MLVTARMRENCTCQVIQRGARLLGARLLDQAPHQQRHQAGDRDHAALPHEERRQPACTEGCEDGTEGYMLARTVAFSHMLDTQSS